MQEGGHIVSISHPNLWPWDISAGPCGRRLWGLHPWGPDSGGDPGRMPWTLFRRPGAVGQGMRPGGGALGRRLA